MGSNSYSRQRVAQASSPPTEDSSFSITEALTTAGNVGATVNNVASYVKPANRNIIGLAGLAAIAYWFYTADKK